ncbi:DUF2339 domain-containing protein [Novosphingobium sp.]|uniref:DUF2339 domain-containing protein n=1 Tax=Novosphingobium sp. TaxID=1874826 RepID=UPI00273628A8|nr:DUF2339 domain-containing protein [Novosphingobium sp.]MDP3906922.1 DUF2339 domain-containing protein [Novosphingobium sp.]
MIWWATIAGVLLGFSQYDFGGIITGGLLGAAMGAWLKHSVQEAITREVERRIAGLELAGVELAKPAAPPSPVTPRAASPWEASTSAAVAEPAAPPSPPQPIPARPIPAQSVAAEPASPAPIEPTAAPTLPVGELFAKAQGWLLGGNTIVRVGLVILFVGLTFLIRLVANSGLFPIEARLATVGAIGAGLLAFGFRKRIEKPGFGLSLQGAGVGVMYLTVFAAARLYDVMPPLAAFGFMIVFAALGCALAILQNSQALALAAFLGGFAVPILLGGESKTPLPLFAYITVLNLAILVIAGKKSWRPLNLLGFFATFTMAGLWGMTSYGDQHYLVCQLFLALTIAIYLAMALLYAHNTPGKLGNAADSTLLFGPALAGFGLQVGLVRDIEFGSAFSALAFGAAYLGVTAFALRKRRGEMQLLNECLLAIGVGFVTLAIPLALDARWTSAAWALEGAGAFWVGARQARWMPRLFGLALQAVAALIVLTTLDGNVSAWPFGHDGFVGPVIVAAALLLTAWWLRVPLPHSGSRLALRYTRDEALLGKPWFLAGFLFAAIALVREVTRKLPAPTSEDYPNFVFTPHEQLLLTMLALLGAMALADWFGRRKDWAVATWPARLSLPLLWVCFLVSVGLGRHVLYLPDLAGWVLALGGHWWLLKRQDGDTGHGMTTIRSTLHAGGVWLLAAMLAESLQLGIDRARLWDTSWAGVIFLVSVTAVLAALTRWAGRAAPLALALGQTEGLRWPLHPNAPAYWWNAAVPLAVLALAGAAFAAVMAQGVTDPLPYLPLLNPVDLSVALALAALALWRRMVASAAHPPAGAKPLLGDAPVIMAGLIAFGWINAIWLRSAHHWLDIPWTPQDLAGNGTVQTGISILWTLLAMALMLAAKRTGARVLWLTGAALLAAVVVKLLLLDMSKVEGLARIIAFMGVGGLMLAIGYFVPLPPRKGGEAQEQPA